MKKKRKSGGQFKPKLGGQFAPKLGGQFDRFFQSKDKNIVYCSSNRGQNFSKNVDYYNYQFIKNEDFSTQQDYNYSNPFIKNNHFLGKHSVRPPTSII